MATAYFGPMLAEAGKDHYRALVKATIGLWRRMRPLKAVSIGTEGKLADSEKYDLLFSIGGEDSDGIRWKLVIQNETDEHIVELGIEQFLGFLAKASDDQDPLMEFSQLSDCRTIGKVRVVTIEKKDGSLIPADPANDNLRE